VGNIRLAFLLNLGFALLEIAGGLWTNSLAILSDAVHDLGDSLSLGLAWFLERYAGRAGDWRYSYGYRRFSLLGALINAMILIGGSLLVIVRAIPRLVHPEPTSATGMLFFAVMGVLVNGFAALRLRQDKSLNARVVAWHLLEDVLGWLAVLVVSVILHFTDLYVLDPLLSLLISLYVLYNAIKNLWETLTLFLQAAPRGLALDEIEAQLSGVDGVCSTHHTHLWSLDGEHHVLSTHLVVDENVTKTDLQRIKSDARQALRPFQLSHITIEIENGEEDCAMQEL
jgi:cobalt-zinc-cadmium efflux system protein